MVSKRGYRYSFVYVDEATHLYGVRHLKKKDDIYRVIIEIERKLATMAKDSVAAAYRHSIKVRKWRTDGDGMFNSNGFGDAMTRRMVAHDQHGP